jgi:hypothetical protein
MKTFVSGILRTSVLAVATLASAGAYAEPDATFGGQVLGTAVDTQATGEEGISGPFVPVRPGDVVVGGRVIGADPDPFIRDQLRREFDSGSPD